MNKLKLNIAKGDSLDVLQYLMTKERTDILNLRQIYIYSVQYNSLKVFNYLESHLNNDNKDNDNSNKKIIKSTISNLSLSLAANESKRYYHAISVVPLSGNIELFKYFLDKVDIRGILLNKSIKLLIYTEYKYIIDAFFNSAEYGRTEMLDHIFGLFGTDKYLLEDVIIPHIPSFFNRIIKSGHLNIIKQYFNNIKIHIKLKDIDILSECAKYNHFEMMKYFHENKIGGSSYSAMYHAVTHENLEMVKWLLENRTEGCRTNAMDNAAQYGHFEIFKWLHHNRTEGCTTYAMDYVAKNGYFEIVKWLHENRTEGCTTDAMDNAAQNGHFEIMKWLHENRTEGCTTNAMNKAAWNGHFEIMKWLHHNRTEGCSTDAMDYTAKFDLDKVKWLNENRTEGCTTKAMDNAAQYGHFEIVKWLHLNRTEGFTVDALICSQSNSHYEIFIWLQQNRSSNSK